MTPIGQDGAEDLLLSAACAKLAARALAGPGDDDDDDEDELPIGDPPDDDEGDDPDDDEDDDDEEPLQLAFAMQHRHGARIAAQCRPPERRCADATCDATAS